MRAKWRWNSLILPFQHPLLLASRAERRVSGHLWKPEHSRRSFQSPISFVTFAQRKPLRIRPSRLRSLYLRFCGAEVLAWRLIVWFARDFRDWAAVRASSCERCWSRRQYHLKCNKFGSSCMPCNIRSILRPPAYESNQHPVFDKYREAYPRKNGSLRNYCLRDGDGRNAALACA